MMKNKNKLILVLLMALLLCFVGVLTACEEEAPTMEIYVTSADAPRLKYVEGQELDLTDGKLTVVTDGVESKLPLNSPDITIEGYSKNTIGDQVLTIKYGELTTNITVNVVARAIAESFETKYFVGDTFNKNMGKIRIATDDAKVFNVNMNDSKVSLVSFDSSVAGTATVTVLYNDGSNSYYCQFDVTVYDQSNIQFTPPIKTSYFSHNEGVNVNGGYFTVTSSDSTLTKNVPLTEDMVKTFDLSAATIENRTTPLEQTVTVEYLGKTFEYDIYITFSEISIIEYYAKGTLADIDWEAVKENGLSEKESQVALDAIHTYLDLSDAQKELISEEATASVIRAGSVALSNAFLKELSNYSKTFTMDSKLSLYLICSDYEQTVADLAKLNDEDEIINVYAQLLRTIKEEYGSLVIEGETTVADCIFVYSEEMQTLLLDILAHFVEVYELVDDIPDTWTAETLKPYGTDILSAAMKIYNAGYYKNGYSNYYINLLSPWRANNDLFEILYTYFLYDYEGGQEFMVNYMWGSMPMPGKLENWYNGLSQVVYYQKYYAANYSSAALLADVSGFMYYYFSTLEIAEEIKSSGNKLWVDIYNAYNGDNMNRIYMYTPNFGYLYHTKGMIDSEAYHQLWADYYAVLKLALNDKLDKAENKTEICAMFNSFQALDPSELLGFLSSLNLMYSSTKGVVPMLQYSEETVYNVFMLVVRDYYLTYLNDACRPIFANLLLAMENYALIGYKETAMADFQSLMQQLTTDYALLSDADRVNFRKYADISYDKYVALYNATTGSTELTLTAEETALLEQLKLAIDEYYTVYEHIYQLVKESEKVPAELYAVLYSLYSKANTCYAAVLATESDAAIMALYVNNYEILDGEYALARAFYMIDSTTTSILIGQTATITNTDGTVSYVTFWNLFADYELAEVLAEMSDLLYYAYFNKDVTPSQSYVLAQMAAVRGFTLMQTRIFTFFSSDVAYYEALNTYFEAVLAKPEVASALIEAEKAYTAYRLDDENAEKRTAFLTAMEELQDDYAATSEEDKAYLNDMYTYYANAYETLTADTTVTV